MEKKIGIVNVNLEYVIPADYKGTDEEFLENVELPKEYVSDSFEIVKVIKERKAGEKED